MENFEERKGKKRDRGKIEKSKEKTPWENEENFIN